MIQSKLSCICLKNLNEVYLCQYLDLKPTEFKELLHICVTGFFQELDLMKILAGLSGI